jgi:hypothetical protein
LILPATYYGLDYCNHELNGDTNGTQTSLGTDIYGHTCVSKYLEGTGSAGDWNNPADFSGDASYADITLDANGNSGFLKLASIGFAIPSGATIRRIAVGIEGGWIDNQSDGTALLGWGLSKDGSNIAGTQYWTSGPPTYNYLGGYKDMWGTTWSYTEVNSANFSLLVQAYVDGLTSGYVTFYCNTPRIVVHYTS